MLILASTHNRPPIFACAGNDLFDWISLATRDKGLRRLDGLSHAGSQFITPRSENNTNFITNAQ
eukprot:COSAG02_NODE_6003_length_3881_cov_2929.265732_4_plen_64_part_00